MASPRKTRIAIACQGGGSQTAFTAGALKALLEAGVHEEYDIVSLSGTSGGAMCAALVWYSLRKREKQPWKRLMDFWKDNTATSPQEIALNRYLVESTHLTNRGLLPSVPKGPKSPMSRALLKTFSYGIRPAFTDMERLLRSHIDFEEMKRWRLSKKHPVLIMGAVEVLSGRLATFSSVHQPVLIEHVMASSTMPDLFPAVRIGERAYWDGVYSDNPPVSQLVQPRHVGEGNLPDEIWVIKINPVRAKHVPESSEEIIDRRNQLSGNISLFHQLDTIAWLNNLFLANAFDRNFLEKHHIQAPIRLPKSYPEDADMPYHIPYIKMSEQMLSSLGVASKLDRSARHIHAMIADGERQALGFLEARTAA